MWIQNNFTFTINHVIFFFKSSLRSENQNTIYYVKYNTLYITLLNGKEIEFESAIEGGDENEPTKEKIIGQEDTPLEDEDFDKVDKLLKEANEKSE